MLADIPENLPEQFWQTVANHLPANTAPSTRATLREVFMDSAYEDGLGDIVFMEQNGPGVIAIGVNMHVIEAYRRQAIAMTSVTPRSFNRMPVHLDDIAEARRMPS